MSSLGICTGSLLKTVAHFKYFGVASFIFFFLFPKGT